MNAKIINVRISSSVAKWLDEQVEKGLYKSRSEAIREYVRTYLRENSP